VPAFGVWKVRCSLSASPFPRKAELAFFVSNHIRGTCQEGELRTRKAAEVGWARSLRQREPIASGCFPISGMVSFVAVMRNGATAEVGITGREGFVGTAVAWGCS
jgi:hypothetical protein